jgi:uncharacterized peroxidase-related enzyme
VSRIEPVAVDSVTGRGAELLEAVKGKLGVVPNMMRTMVRAPAVLEAYLGFSGALAKASLSAQTREAIALAVGQANRCQYCVSAHTLLGGKAGLKDTDVVAARSGESRDAKSAAALRFALAVNDRRGNVTDADLAAARAAGLNEAEIIEVVGVVALNVFTNYFNHVADPQIDFPVVKL